MEHFFFFSKRETDLGSNKLLIIECNKQFFFSEPPESHKSLIERRQAVSDWLMNVVAASVKQDLTVEDSIKNVFTLLTGQCVQEACQQAQSIGENTELVFFKYKQHLF